MAIRILRPPAVVGVGRSLRLAVVVAAAVEEVESGRNRLPAAAVAAAVRQTLEASSNVRMIHACIASA